MCGDADVTSGILWIKSADMICGCKGKLRMCGFKLTASSTPSRSNTKVLLYNVGSGLYMLTSKKPLKVSESNNLKTFSKNP